MAWIDEDFLLRSGAARRLYHAAAAAAPVLDFHTHLSARDLAVDRRFENLSELWLEGDHYKWRAMRAAGVDEGLVQSGDPETRFTAWAWTVPQTLRNPLFHWTHLELRRVFGFDGWLDPQSAPHVWALARERLSEPEFSARGLVDRFAVHSLCTTDDPCDDLEWHRRLAASSWRTRVWPTFRPDGAIRVHAPAAFNAWVDRLEGAANVSIGKLSDFLDALQRRQDAFHAAGCRLSDHGLESLEVPGDGAPSAEASFARLRSRQPIEASAAAALRAELLQFFGRRAAELGWTQQLHLGPRRDNCSRLVAAVGADAGGDAIGETPQAAGLAWHLDRLDRGEALPRTIVYYVNPADAYPLAAMLGCFQDGSIPHKLQLGPAWWFLDHRQGIIDQLNVVSQTGLLSGFVGMVTDSRSLLSLVRHEYFRRVLCDVLGGEMESGELPDELPQMGALVRRIAYDNAAAYLRLPH